MTTNDVNVGSLTITEIEQIPIVVPLGREYKGSYYSMTHRATVLTRVHTVEGLIGTAYAATRSTPCTRSSRWCSARSPPS